MFLIETSRYKYPHPIYQVIYIYPLRIYTIPLRIYVYSLKNLIFKRFFKCKKYRSTSRVIDFVMMT